MKKPTTITEYIDSFPKETQKALKQIRATVKKVVPKAEEGISYGIAQFKLNGKMLVYFAGFKNHVSMYPMPRNEKSFEKDFAKYYTSGKGTIQFPIDKPLPVALVTKITKYMLKQNLERTKAAASKKLNKKGK